MHISFLFLKDPCRCVPTYTGAYGVRAGPEERWPEKGLHPLERELQGGSELPCERREPHAGPLQEYHCPSLQSQLSRPTMPVSKLSFRSITLGS